MPGPRAATAPVKVPFAARKYLDAWRTRVPEKVVVNRGTAWRRTTASAASSARRRVPDAVAIDTTARGQQRPSCSGSATGSRAMCRRFVTHLHRQGAGGTAPDSLLRLLRSRGFRRNGLTRRGRLDAGATARPELASAFTAQFLEAEAPLPAISTRRTGRSVVALDAVRQDQPCSGQLATARDEQVRQIPVDVGPGTMLIVAATHSTDWPRALC